MMSQTLESCTTGCFYSWAVGEGPPGPELKASEVPSKMDYIFTALKSWEVPLSKQWAVSGWRLCETWAEAGFSKMNQSLQVNVAVSSKIVNDLYSPAVSTNHCWESNLSKDLWKGWLFVQMSKVCIHLYPRSCLHLIFKISLEKTSRRNSETTIGPNSMKLIKDNTQSVGDIGAFGDSAYTW